MKATGIVRRIDELGRVVIPKEIRRTQRIRRGHFQKVFAGGGAEQRDDAVCGRAEQEFCTDGLRL